MEERLQKYLAACGVASRRKAEILITEGHVSVNGKIVIQMGTCINPEIDVVSVDGKPVGREEHIYIMLNKPVGYLSSCGDERGRKTVLDIITGLDVRLYPVGRLDYDSSGLLLMTNDGDFSWLMTHPSHEIDKIYEVVIHGSPDSEKVKMLEEGIIVQGKKTSSAQLRLISSGEDDSRWHITIHEGRKRQVRMMFASIGHPVISLRRIALGKLILDDLEVGSYRHLTQAEINSLKEQAGSLERMNDR